ncbi:hypothetical protein TOPH_01195 [Tolypocladium ophioglossoides CBS 100239]|uniref:Uncharacterized protein n=1 Tax=Tolypocladium ophioglossoides (strain CBS 100239) TaxID=1163406 RepID=A0A0L0NIY7_TOLOC|nr:hypothetical protein TOPH_01195 [Tolypocladium ophioglossoides CBS 100239]
MAWSTRAILMAMSLDSSSTSSSSSPSSSSPSRSDNAVLRRGVDRDGNSIQKQLGVFFVTFGKSTLQRRHLLSLAHYAFQSCFVSAQANLVGPDNLASSKQRRERLSGGKHHLLRVVAMYRPRGTALDCKGEALRVTVGCDGGDEQELPLDFIHITISDDLRRWVLLLHAVGESRRSFCRRSFVDERFVSDPGRESQPFVDDLEIPRDEFLAFGNPFIYRRDGTLRPRELGKVKHIRLVLHLELLVCGQRIAPRLSFLKVLNHVKVDLLLALKEGLCRKFRLRQCGSLPSRIPLVQVGVKAQSQTSLGVVPRFRLEARQLMDIANENLLLLHVTQELHQAQPIDDIRCLVAAVTAVNSNQQVQEFIQSGDKLPNSPVEWLVRRLRERPETLQQFANKKLLQDAFGKRV